MTIGRRLVALAKDPEVPRWCKVAVVVGAAVPTPLELDEIFLYPAIMGYLFFRRRHVLHRHGFTGVHVLAGIGTLVFLSFVLGFVIRDVAGAF